MPNYPALQEQDVTQPLDLSKLEFPIGREMSAGFSNAYERMTLNEVTNNLSKIKPDPQYPLSQPMTTEDVKNLQIDRPELKVPTGIPKFIGNMMSSMYDNDKNFSLVAQHPASIWGKYAGLGSSVVGGLANVKALIAGAGIAKAGGLAAEAIAETAMGTFGVREMYGSAAARIGTLLAQGAGEGAGFGVGQQATVEQQEQQKRSITMEPHNYIQSLQNIGEAGLFGAGLGIAGKGIGITLFGRKVTSLPNGTIMEHGAETGIPESGLNAAGKPFIEGGEVKNVGGLFNRPEFANIPETTKKYVGKIYKPWSKDSDITMREEGTGQMLNGQFPAVDVVMKQGMVDEGANFRNAARRDGVDLEEFDRSLADAQENITSELFTEHFAEKFDKAAEDNTFKSTSGANVETYHNGPQFVTHIDHNDNIKVLKDEKGNRAVVVGTSIKENGVSGGVEMTKAAIKEAQNRDLNFVSDSVVTPNVMKVYKRLEKEGYKFEYNPDVTETTGEGGSIKGKKVIQSNDGKSPVVKLISSPEKVIPESQLRSKRIDDLSRQYMLAQSMRDHINNSHEPLTQEEVKAYSDHLKTTGIPDNGYSTDAPEGLSVDDYLNEFSDKQIQELADSFGADKEIMREIDQTREKLSKQKVFADMAQNLTDCIMKGAE